MFTDPLPLTRVTPPDPLVRKLEPVCFPIQCSRPHSHRGNIPTIIFTRLEILNVSSSVTEVAFWYTLFSFICSFLFHHNLINLSRGIRDFVSVQQLMKLLDSLNLKKIVFKWVIFIGLN